MRVDQPGQVRLARDLLIQEQLLAEVWQHGEVFSAAGGEQDLRNDEGDPSRKLVRRLLGAVAEYERELIVLRLKRGRGAQGKAGRVCRWRPALRLARGGA